MSARGRGLAAVSRAAATSSPVFIVGEVRSGTSILYRILQRHPSFAPRALNLAESYAVIELARLDRFDGGLPTRLREFLLFDEDEERSFAATVRPLHPWRHISTGLAARTSAGSMLAWRARLDPVVLRAYFHHAQRARACRRLVEKTPVHLPFTRHLQLGFPSARLLYVLRHPVDVLSSYWKREAFEPASASWTNITVGRFCTQYHRRVTRALAEAARDPDRFLIVRYERLATEPEETVREVCAFVGETFDAEMLGDDLGAGTSTADPHLYGSVVARTKDWRDFVGERDAVAVEDRLADLLAMVGYRRYTPVTQP